MSSPVRILLGQRRRNFRWVRPCCSSLLRCSKRREKTSSSRPRSCPHAPGWQKSRTKEHSAVPQCDSDFELLHGHLSQALVTLGGIGRQAGPRNLCYIKQPLANL